MDFRASRLKVSCVLFDFFSLIFQIFFLRRVFDHLYLRSEDFAFFLVSVCCQVTLKAFLNRCYFLGRGKGSSRLL